MKLNLNAKKVAGVGAVALFSMAMSGTAAAADTPIGVTSTVQNALTVTKVADMNLGSIFATTASSGGYRFMTLTTAGTMSAPQGSGAGTILSLGGMSAGDATVAVSSTTPFNLTLPAFEVALNADGTTNLATVTGFTTPVEVQLADPLVARFTLANFRAGTPTGGTVAAGCSTSNVCVMTPSFGTTDMGFKIGADIVTDLSGTRVTYEAGTYTGTFDVSATY